MEEGEHDSAKAVCQFGIVAGAFIAHKGVGTVDLMPVQAQTEFVEASEDSYTALKRDVRILPSPDHEQFAADVFSAFERVVVHTLAERDFDAAFDDLGRAQASAVLVFPDALFTGVRGRLAELATRHKLPVLYPDRSYVEAGGLMSYGSSRTDAYREAGIYVGRILRGEKPSDLPVIQASKFELVINLKTAKALSLEIPPMLLALTDEVIE